MRAVMVPVWARVSVWCLAGVAGHVHAQSTPAFSITLAPVAQASAWHEFNSSGGELLRERGVLVGQGLQARLQSGASRWAVSAQAVSGLRQYDGQDNAGHPAHTDVRVRLTQFGLAWQYVWPSGGLLGVEGQRRDQRRELLSIPGGAVGYTEYWRSDAVLLRAGLEADWHGRWRTSVAWAPWVRTRMVLQQPYRDEAHLTPTAPQLAQLQIGWDTAVAPQWRWGWLGQVDWLRSAPSEAVPLTRMGRLVAVARQPETTESSATLALHVHYQW